MIIEPPGWIAARWPAYQGPGLSTDRDGLSVPHTTVGSLRHSV
jgi:hypothetical protein